MIVRKYIRHLCPKGTNVGENNSTINYPPGWPPDLFGISASLLLRTGGYWSPTIGPGERKVLNTSDASLQELIRAYGYIEFNSRRNCGFTSAQRKVFGQLWQTLLADDALHFSAVSAETKAAALTLMLIADAASEGAGRWMRARPLAVAIAGEYGRRSEPSPDSLHELPRSLCRAISADYVRVLPKMCSPAVGQTVRTLSRHLSLVETSEVDVRWLFGVTREEVDYASPSTLNLLLVPFPYRIEESHFLANPVPLRVLDSDRWCFDLRQEWLKDLSGGRGLIPFLCKLVRAAERDGTRIDSVVLPELAVADDAAEDIANGVQEECPTIRMFICGVGRGIEHDSSSSSINSCRTFVFNNGGPLLDWRQSKHHQWRLEHSQISKYGLNAQLKSNKEWWEDFSIRRECVFCSLDGGFSITTLICEDIARVDPVLPIIRAVGPNLVIALLMDDVQAKGRWSGAAAQAIADDPGSCVITFTSLGLIDQVSKGAASGPVKVALCATREKGKDEILMGRNDHGVVIKLRTTGHVQPDVQFDGQFPVSVGDDSFPFAARQSTKL